MSKPDLPDSKLISRISPMYQKQHSPDGDGFAGFTMYFTEEKFKNHIQFFNKSNKQEILEQVRTLRETVCTSCAKIQEQEMNHSSKERRLCNKKP